MCCSTGLGNQNIDLVTSWTEVERLNGYLTAVRDALTTVGAEAVQSVDISDFQKLETYLSQRVEEASVNSDVCILVRPQLAHRICFVFECEIRMATLSMAAVFEDVSHDPNFIVLQTRAGLDMMGTLIDEEDYRESERNHLVGTIFSGGELPVDF